MLNIPKNIEEAINQLRHERNAVILAHYYQDEEIQDIADFVGDSLDLSKKAKKTDAKVIVFCGVKFMAEVAKVLNPKKTVLLPDIDAGCSLEESCQPGPFKKFREKHPDHLAITYINCSAEIKALSDIIVTSSNAETIINQIPEDKNILFAPDRHLGSFLSKKTGRKLLLWPGTCIVHEQFSERELIRLKTKHPKAVVTAHPECPSNILDFADHIGSTSSMIQFVKKSNAKEFIIGTEPHLIHQMKKGSPEKKFFPLPGSDGKCSCVNCPFMELNTLEKLYLCMKKMTPRIKIEEKLRIAAYKPLNRMLEMSNNPKAGSLNLNKSPADLVA